MFNKYTGPTNKVHLQVDFDLQTGEIHKIFDELTSLNDRCSMYHDISYSVAENIGKNNKDIKRLKHLADDKWLKCFKPRSPWDIAAYNAIKSKKVYGQGNNFTMNDLSEELRNLLLINLKEKKSL